MSTDYDAVAMHLVGQILRINNSINRNRTHITSQKRFVETSKPLCNPATEKDEVVLAREASRVEKLDNDTKLLVLNEKALSEDLAKIAELEKQLAECKANAAKA
ncbi:hypothetical protein BGZ81_008100 [Podila clonocystis]|nr:hypothetical protein BGZ81_008100 [Podila clonocystis]